MMRPSVIAASALLGMILMWPLPRAFAQSKSGFELFVGRAWHEGTIDFADPMDTDIEYESSGALIGLGYLHSVWGRLSIGGRVATTLESSDQLENSIVHGLLVAELRAWPWKGWFVGAHYGLYSMAFDLPGEDPEQVSGNDEGGGVTTGWEWQSGWFVEAQADWFGVDEFDESDNITANATIKGARIIFGFRWRDD